MPLRIGLRLVRYRPCPRHRTFYGHIAFFFVCRFLSYRNQFFASNTRFREAPWFGLLLVAYLVACRVRRAFSLSPKGTAMEISRVGHPRPSLFFLIFPPCFIPNYEVRIVSFWQPYAKSFVISVLYELWCCASIAWWGSHPSTCIGDNSRVSCPLLGLMRGLLEPLLAIPLKL